MHYFVRLKNTKFTKRMTKSWVCSTQKEDILGERSSLSQCPKVEIPRICLGKSEDTSGSSRKGT